MSLMRWPLVLIYAPQSAIYSALVCNNKDADSQRTQILYIYTQMKQNSRLGHRASIIKHKTLVEKWFQSPRVARLKDEKTVNTHKVTTKGTRLLRIFCKILEIVLLFGFILWTTVIV